MVRQSGLDTGNNSISATPASAGIKSTLAPVGAGPPRPSATMRCLLLSAHQPRGGPPSRHNHEGHAPNGALPVTGRPSSLQWSGRRHRRLTAAFTQGIIGPVLPAHMAHNLQTPDRSRAFTFGGEYDGQPSIAPACAPRDAPTPGQPAAAGGEQGSPLGDQGCAHAWTARRWLSVIPVFLRVWCDQLGTRKHSMSSGVALSRDWQEECGLEHPASAGVPAPNAGEAGLKAWLTSATAGVQRTLRGLTAAISLAATVQRAQGARDDGVLHG